MGIDLTLLPVAAENQDGSLICTVAFDFDLSRLVNSFSQLERYPVDTTVIAPVAELPKELLSQFTHGDFYVGGPYQFAYMGPVTVDGYGSDLTYLLAGTFQLLLKNEPDLQIGINNTELAAIRYLCELHWDTRIILYFW